MPQKKEIPQAIYPSARPEYRKKFDAARRAAMSPEERSADLAARREKYRLTVMTPEQIARRKQILVEWRRKNETPETYRAKNLKYKEYYAARARRLNPQRLEIARAKRAADPLSDKQPGRRFSQYKFTAKQRGHEFLLTREEFMSFWQKPCHYCGDEIKTIGIDRVDNARGYLIGNCVSCCGVCNAMKMAASYDEFIKRICRIAVKHSCIN